MFTFNCAPTVVLNRGVWFGGDAAGHFIELVDVDLSYSFTLELWVNPYGSGSLINTVANREIYNGNFWVSDCFGLVLDVGL